VWFDVAEFNTANYDKAPRGGAVIFESITLTDANFAFSAYSMATPNDRLNPDIHPSSDKIDPSDFEDGVRTYSYRADFDYVPLFAGARFGTGNCVNNNQPMACVINFADVTFGGEPTKEDWLIAAATQAKDGATGPPAMLAAGQSIIFGSNDENYVCRRTNRTEQEQPITKLSPECP
jgi:hypothetical protein